MKYKFKQTPNQTVRKFTSGNIGTGSLFRSDKNLEAYRVSRKHLYFLSAFLGSSFFKPSRMPWHLHCLNPQWSLQVLKLEVRSHGRSIIESPSTRVLGDCVVPPLHFTGCIAGWLVTGLNENWVLTPTSVFFTYHRAHRFLIVPLPVTLVLRELF